MDSHAPHLTADAKRMIEEQGVTAQEQVTRQLRTQLEDLKARAEDAEGKVALVRSIVER